MRISVYQKERIEKRDMGAGRPFKLDSKEQISNAFSVLSSLYNYTLAGFLI